MSGARLGIAVSHDPSDEMLIFESVGQDSVLSLWNVKFPDQAVQEKDMILQVNNVSGNAEKMKEELKYSAISIIKVQREATSSAETQDPAEVETEIVGSDRDREARSMADTMRMVEVREREETSFTGNSALRSITESTGPHDVSVWKAAAEWSWFWEPRISPVSAALQVRFYLELFGYSVTDHRSWGNQSDMPSLSIDVTTHIEQAGFTWYLVTCTLKANTPNFSLMPCDGRPYQLDWEAPRRLCHLRADLHDRLKYDMEASQASQASQYSSIFEGKPFALHGAPKGTTARLSAWLQALAKAINEKQATPAQAAATLHFFYAPLPQLQGELGYPQDPHTALGVEI
eukprot:TRINITY_DN38245_c0_g1_i1.p1 TRINITY_DN38245_c0_g1~~TRINITY_DN38245_c0_g1_i1.p1  ORF type:complete len:396 (+),score=73.54 TRINITY_DN38245_c0_g1_i1:154-1188(+)